MRDDEVRGVEVEAKQVTTGEYPWPTRGEFWGGLPKRKKRGLLPSDFCFNCVRAAEVETS